MNYIPRKLEKELKASSKEYPIIALLGPRQSGKTTLVQKVFPKKEYVSLENLDNRTFALKDPNGFLDLYKKGAILDEVQRVPSLFSYLQTKVDHDKKKGQFILTGSNQILLEERIAQSLAGRVSLLRLLPLSLSEIKSKKKLENLNEVLFKGFYPQIHAERKLRLSHWFDNYIDTYVNKDIRLVQNITSLSLFNDFLKLCAARAGQLLNLQSISNDCGISQNTVKSWLSILESTFIIKKVAPFYKNFNKRITKSPKIFFYDTGLLCRLLSIKKPDDIKTHYLKGFLFENFVFIELEKYFFNKAEKSNIYFWRTKTGHEIDFLIDELEAKILEVKSSQTISYDFFKNINYFQKCSKTKAQPYLIYGGIKSFKQDQVQVTAWTQIESCLKK